MNVLIDTSIWVDRFRKRNQKLSELLARCCTDASDGARRTRMWDPACAAFVNA